jgi:hypothetical protein
MNDTKPGGAEIPTAVKKKVWHAPVAEMLPLDATAASSYPGNDSGGGGSTSLS